MRRTLAAVVVAAGLLGATSAKAQERFASKGTAAFSADRLFGLTLHHESTQVGGGVAVTADTTDFGLAWRTPQDHYEIPRLSFDYFVINGLNIGGSIAFANVSGDAHGSDFLFVPRVGYCWMFNDVVGFWLRGGVSYHNRSYRGSRGEWDLALEAEGMFVITPVNHFGFVVGPTMDISLAGKRNDGDGNVDHHYRDIGLFNAGLIGWL